MMAPDYAHWHGMYEVAERFYQELIPQAREIAEHAAEEGNEEAAEKVEATIEEILARPEHKWFQEEKSLEETAEESDADSNEPPAEDTAAKLPNNTNAGG